MSAILLFVFWEGECYVYRNRPTILPLPSTPGTRDFTVLPSEFDDKLLAIIHKFRLCSSIAASLIQKTLRINAIAIIISITLNNGYWKTAEWRPARKHVLPSQQNQSFDQPPFRFDFNRVHYDWDLLCWEGGLRVCAGIEKQKCV